jgi:ribosome-binding ATPase
MKVGLVGFAGSGKSTAFQWLTGVAPDPSKTNQGQLGSADVPDERLAAIAADLKPKKTTYCKLEFLDTPGLSTDDRKDNPRRLAVIREANGIVIVVDCYSRKDAAAQLAKFCEELLFADLEVVSNRVPKVEAQLKKTKPAKEKEADQYELALLQRVVAAFEAGTPASAMGLATEDEKLLRSFQLLTLKPMAAFLNCGDSGFADAMPADVLAQCPVAVRAPVKLEMELAALDAESREMFMADLGLTQSYRAACLRDIFYGMGRQVFMTVGTDECRTWAMPAGSSAPEAAGCIHKDLMEKFVRANVISYADFLACHYSEKDAKAKGVMRTEGKAYIVQDADILHILASA